eukprot:CCRYP_006156-RA/>CCRYP_006156-RA protein AED:0.46 eAED:1.00 QI:0/0/0/1/0/0/2/0/72
MGVFQRRLSQVRPPILAHSANLAFGTELSSGTMELPFQMTLSYLGITWVQASMPIVRLRTVPWSTPSLLRRA